jgi:hypothetical protein
MAEFINIYAGALVALSSLRDHAGSPDKIPQQTDNAGRPAKAGCGLSASPLSPETALALQP